MDLWTVLLVWGALQGVLLATALLLRPRDTGSGAVVLGALMLAFSLPLAEHACLRQGWFVVDAHGFIVFLTTPALFLPGPLFYLYARRLKGDGHPSRTWPHFIPAALMLLNYAPAYTALIASTLGVRDALPWRVGQLVWINGYVAWGLELVQLAAYLLASRPILREFETALRSDVSRSGAIQADWLRRLAGLLLGVAAVNVIALIGMLTIRHIAAFEYAIALAYATGVHVVGFMAVREPRIFRYRREPERADAAAVPPAEGPRYAKSGLTEADRRRLAERLVRVMDDTRPWLDENLRLRDLAKLAAMPSAHVSEVLSRDMGTNFFDFVNGYRVSEARRRLSDWTPGHPSLLALALACGFSSKSSFNRVFKRVTGMTPTQFARDAAQHPPRPEAGAPEAIPRPAEKPPIG